MTKKLNRDDGENGWILNFKTIDAIREQASNMENVSAEQVEAVALAMIDLGYASIADIESSRCRVALGPPWCMWRRDKKGPWHVECLDREWAIWDDGPAVNEFVYCPFCGDPLKVEMAPE